MFSWPNAPLSSASLIDEKLFRKSLGSFPTGVCLVTTIGHDGKKEGMTINSFSSVSLAPPLILWSVREAARSADMFMSSPYFVLSILAQDQSAIASHFARPALDKFEAYSEEFEDGISGCPKLKESVATYECKLYSTHQEGDHTIMIGRVERFSFKDQAPLMFHSGRMGSMNELALTQINQSTV